MMECLLVGAKINEVWRVLASFRDKIDKNTVFYQNFM